MCMCNASITRSEILSTYIRTIPALQSISPIEERTSERTNERTNKWPRLLLTSYLVIITHTHH